MAEVRYSVLHEVALEFSSVDFVFAHDLKDLFEMGEVFFFGLAVNSYVVNVYNCEFSYDWSEYHIHEALESGWGTFESKWHDFPLVESSFDSGYGKCGFLSVFICESNLVVATGEVEG